MLRDADRLTEAVEVLTRLTELQLGATSAGGGAHDLTAALGGGGGGGPTDLSSMAMSGDFAMTSHVFDMSGGDH